MPANESIVFNVDCGTWNDEKCNQVKDDLSTVGGLIGNELMFRVPVVACVNLVDVARSGRLYANLNQVVNLTMGKMSCKSY